MSAYELAALGIDLRGRNRGQVKTTCPECSHTRHKKLDPCLSVNIDEGVYHCHNCGWAGGTSGGKRDAYSAPPAPRAWTKPDHTPAETVPPSVLDYLAKRGITREVAERNRVGSAVVAIGKDRGKRPTIAFPYFRDGQIVNVKYRTLDKQFRMVWGAELTLYGIDDIRPDQPLIWCEGEPDKLALEVAGYRAAVSVPNGAPSPTAKNYTKHFEYLGTEAERLGAVKRHIIAVDADEPGKVLQGELIRRLGPEKCAVAEWPVGCKDANETLVKLGVEGVRAAIEQARSAPVVGLYDADDLWTDIIDLYVNGLAGGVNPGTKILGEHYTVKEGQWTLVTGIPGHGKSAVIDWMMVNLARDHGWRFAICSPENQPLARHAAQLMQIWAGKPFGQGAHERMSEDEVWAAHAWLREHFVFILPGQEDGFRLDNVLDLARKATLRMGIKGLVIDPWNELDQSRTAGMREDEHVSVSLGRLRQFARNSAVHVWLVAHPTKLQKDADGRYPVPTPYNVSGGGQFNNKADMAISVYRDVLDAARGTELHIQKVRFRECGQVGMVPLYHDKLTGRYGDMHPAERAGYFDE